jgi:hypothetical protein
VRSVPQKSMRSSNMDLRRQPKVSCWVKHYWFVLVKILG